MSTSWESKHIRYRRELQESNAAAGASPRQSITGRANTGKFSAALDKAKENKTPEEIKKEEKVEKAKEKVKGQQLVQSGAAQSQMLKDINPLKKNDES